MQQKKNSVLSFGLFDFFLILNTLLFSPNLTDNKFRALAQHSTAFRDYNECGSVMHVFTYLRVLSTNSTYTF